MKANGKKNGDDGRKKTRLSESAHASVATMGFTSSDRDELKGLLSSGMKAPSARARERAADGAREKEVSERASDDDEREGDGGE